MKKARPGSATSQTSEDQAANGESANGEEDATRDKDEREPSAEIDGSTRQPQNTETEGQRKPHLFVTSTGKNKF